MNCQLFLVIDSFFNQNKHSGSSFTDVSVEETILGLEGIKNFFY